MKESKKNKAKDWLDWLVGIASIVSCIFTGFNLHQIQTINIEIKQSTRLQQEIIEKTYFITDTVFTDDTVNVQYEDKINQDISTIPPKTLSPTKQDDWKEEIDSAANRLFERLKLIFSSQSTN